MKRACIYCGSHEVGRSVIHIVPESLGGPNSPIAPPGTVCDACNQYFGQKVEADALASFPFNGFRLMIGVPSKKGRMISVETHIGRVFATGTPGILSIEPANEGLAERISNGSVTQFMVMAEITEPFAVARMLLKIGLEFLGKHFYDVAVSERVREARDFARRPQKGRSWWFVLRSDPTELLSSNAPQILSPWEIEVREIDNTLTSVLRLPGTETMIPLECRTCPPEIAELPEPLYRVVHTTC